MARRRAGTSMLPTRLLPSAARGGVVDHDSSRTKLLLHGNALVVDTLSVISLPRCRVATGMRTWSTRCSRGPFYSAPRRRRGWLRWCCW